MFNYSATIQQKRKKCGGRPRNGNKILRFYEKIQIRNDFKEILEDFRFFIFENSYFRRRGNPIIAIGKISVPHVACYNFVTSTLSK